MTDFLKEPSAASAADQCRELGIVVGDTIEGSETHTGGWNEARLTLVFLGDTECVWIEQSRNSRREAWSDPVESSSWTLDCRSWRKVSSAPQAQTGRHTTGPWKAAPAVGNWRVHSADDKHKNIAILPCGEADARLIAAAPDMLKALTSIMLCEFNSMSSRAEMVRLARAAIDKATGGAP